MIYSVRFENTLPNVFCDVVCEAENEREAMFDAMAHREAIDARLPMLRPVYVGAASVRECVAYGANECRAVVIDRREVSQAMVDGFARVEIEEAFPGC